MLAGEIRDRNLDYLLKRKWVSAAEVAYGQVTGASTLQSSGFGAGDKTLEELGTSNVGAIKISATTDTVDWLWVPWDFDNRNRLLIRHLWTSNYGTANGTATFVTTYNAHVLGDVPVIGATALGKTIPLSTKISATARATYWTDYGVVAPLATGAFANHTFPIETAFITFSTLVTAVTGITIGTDFVWWLGMELVYTPRMTFGDGSRREARLLQHSLGDSEMGAASDV